MRGLDRINAAFSRQSESRIMAHAICGYPDMETSLRIMEAMAASGASIIEAQIPFSEPSADGPLIIEAGHAALRSGATTRGSLAMLKKLRERVNPPILAMSYLNPIVAFGAEAFVGALVDAGIDGAIIPDFPDDEPEPPLREFFAEAGLALVPLIAPSTSLDRAREIAAKSASPLLYIVLRLGVTGRRTEVDAAALERLKSLGQATGKLLAAGFGIRDRGQVEALAGSADCAIVGSAVLAEIRRALEEGRDPATATADFLGRLLSTS